jgi:hypothetical protein
MFTRIVTFLRYRNACAACTTPHTSYAFESNAHVHSQLVLLALLQRVCCVNHTAHIVCL